MSEKKIRKKYHDKIDFKLDLPDTNNKKEKARQSAKNTRQRKKAYIDSLEQKVLNQQKCEVAQLTAQLNQNKKVESKPSLMQLMEQFLLDRKQQFDMLEKAYQEGNEANIKVITNSLRFKYGISGQGRLMAINKVFELLIDLLLPMHMRYLFWVASEDVDIFKRERQSSEFYSFDMSDSQINCLNSFGLDDDQILKIQNMQQTIQEQRSHYDNLIIEIYKIQQSIVKESEKCQTIVDEIWDVLEPKQAAGLLITLDKANLFSNNRVELNNLGRRKYILIVQFQRFKRGRRKKYKDNHNFPILK
ncbi:unnamed protein product (macronuclear) [Paramecium tetraurelia]|uniref:BZIP domain-containing protein n=1 Tax=Paramecium tetraurelia TaxID=5888 RepID=A0E8B0_PARTE|nr:uncharacterized protein GSPATT00024255001 [Paramecium tetraurelia]CAK91527.1 unnamed protein product [Paramecium tetraurelia]|eukprot:XP_001458924.1 hypothetical protein (macronuclear) [Paramecium tetraurelia strain d4-2]